MPNTTTPFSGEFPRELVQRRGFLDAGRAPGGPEVQDQDLASEIGTEMDRPFSVAMVNPGAASPATTTRS